MHNVDQRLATLRQEIDLLKAARRVTVNPDRQHQIYMRLSACILESIRLIETRIQAYAPQQPAEHTRATAHNTR